MQAVKKRWEYLFAPLVVMAIVLYIFKGYELFPFGKNALNWGDMSQQNLPVLIQFRDVLLGKQGSFFSMVNAGGMDYSGIFLFLASSPFSLLAAFISKSNLVFYINIMILLKLMTCSLTASIFFKRFFDKLTPLQNIALSVAYALCGYSMMFYQLHTWLDVMYMFPLLLIAMDKLINEFKIYPYVITLSFMILFQFYLGYMLALFIIFFFLLYILFFHNENKKKAILFFGIGTILALMITSPVLFTALEQFLKSARGVNILENLVCGDFFTHFPTTIPFLLATSLIIIAIPFMYILKINKNKNVRFIYVIFVLMVIPVIIEPVNKIWHTGSYQAFPVRYGYITVLIGLSLFAAIITEMNKQCDNAQPKERAIPKIVSVMIILMFYIFIKRFVPANADNLNSYSTTLWGSDKSFTSICIYSLVAIIVISILLVQFKFKRIGKQVFSFVLCLFVVAEGLFNTSVYLGFGARDTKSYHEIMSLKDKIDDDSAYRLKTYKKYFDVNLIGAMGYNSLAHYTSLIDENYIYAMKKFGYSSYWMEVNSNDSTVLSDAFMGNKYTLYNFYDYDMKKDIVYNDDIFYICKNEFNMSLGNVISKDRIMSVKDIPEMDRISFQNLLYKTLTGLNDDIVTRYNPLSTNNVNLSSTSDRTVYEKLNDDAGIITYEIYVEGRQNLYFDCFDKLTTNLTEPINDSFNIYIDNVSAAISFPNKRQNGIVDLGVFEDEIVSVTVKVLKSGSANSFGVFGIDLDKLATGINSVKPADVKVKGDLITVNATADNNDQMLLLSIPYSRGFNVYVNDKKVDAERVLDTFMAIPLEKGKNEIRMTYRSYGLLPGLVIAAIGVILLIFISVIIKKYKKILILENIVYIGFIIIAGIIFILVYILPVILYLVCKFIN